MIDGWFGDEVIADQYRCGGAIGHDYGLFIRSNKYGFGSNAYLAQYT